MGNMVLRSRSKTWSSYLVCGILAGLLPFASLLLSSDLSFSLRDHMLLWMPMKLEWLKSWELYGKVSSWTHAIYGGAPFWADPSIGNFTPLNFFFPLLGRNHFHLAYELYIAAHYTLVFWSAIFCFRAFRIRRAYAIAGAFLLTWSGSLISANVSIFSVGSLAGVLCVLGAWRKLRRNTELDLHWFAWLWFLGLAWAMPVIHGEPQFAYLAVWFVGFDLVLSSIQRRRAGLAFQWQPPLAFALSGIGGFLASAIQLLPSIELTQNSDRWNIGVSLDHSMRWSTPPARLFEFLAPNFFGDLHAHYWGSRLIHGIQSAGDIPFVLSIYLGPITLFGALIFFVLGRRRLVLTSICIFLAWVVMGDQVPLSLYELLFRVVPGWSTFRFPERLIHLLVLALIFASLSGLARLEVLLRGHWEKLSPKYKLFLFLPLPLVLILAYILFGGEDGVPKAIFYSAATLGLAFLCIFLANAKKLSVRLVLPLILLIGIFDLYAFSRSQIFEVSASFFELKNHKVFSEIRADLDRRAEEISQGAAYRTVTLMEQTRIESPVRVPGLLDRPTALLALAFAQGLPNSGMYFDIEYLQGYHTLSPYLITLFTRRLKEMPDRNLALRGVYYMLDRSEDKQSVVLKKYERPLPHLFQVQRLRNAAGFNESIDAVAAADFDPHVDTAIAPPRGQRHLPTPRNNDYDSNAKIRILHRENDYLKVEFLPSRDLKETIFVWNENNYAHWKVRVDGKDRLVYQANALAMATDLGPSQASQARIIEFKYQNPMETIGLWLSVLWLALGFIGLGLYLGQCSSRRGEIQR